MDSKKNKGFIGKILNFAKSLDKIQLILVCAGTIAVLGVLIYSIIQSLHLTAAVMPDNSETLVSQEQSLPPVVAEGSSNDIIVKEEKVDNLACFGVYADNGIAVMLRDGTVVTDDIYYTLGDYVGEDDLVAVADNTPTLSYIDYKTGQTVLTTEYAAGSAFSGGLAAVSIPNPMNSKYYIYGYIDRQGNLVHNFDLMTAKTPSEGLALVSPGDTMLYGFIDKTGEYVIPAEFTNAGSFHDGIAPAAKDEKWGFINTKGEFIVDPSFDKIGQFSEGFAKVCVGDKWGFIDASGNYIAAPQFEDCEDFKNGAAPVKYNGLYGYINTKGQFIIEPKFQEAYGFFGGLASVKINDKFGYIDVNGNVVIEAKYDSTFDFYEGIARVKEGTAYYYIDVNGNPISTDRFTSGTDFVAGTAIVSIGDSYGIIDKKGGFVVSPKYKSIKNVYFFKG